MRLGAAPGRNGSRPTTTLRARYISRRLQQWEKVSKSLAPRSHPWTNKSIIRLYYTICWFLHKKQSKANESPFKFICQHNIDPQNWSENSTRPAPDVRQARANILWSSLRPQGTGRSCDQWRNTANLSTKRTGNDWWPCRVRLDRCLRFRCAPTAIWLLLRHKTSGERQAYEAAPSTQRRGKNRRYPESSRCEPVKHQPDDADARFGAN